jgi:hypothetical protein
MRGFACTVTSAVPAMTLDAPKTMPVGLQHPAGHRIHHDPERLTR